MARGPSSARRPERDEARPGLEGVDGAGGALTPRDLDRLIHQRTRLSIVTLATLPIDVSALAVAESLSLNDLKAARRTSDGNLSVHARKLEDAGYLECTKSFADRTPRTVYRLTAEGRRALESYLGHMEALIDATRESSTHAPSRKGKRQR